MNEQKDAGDVESTADAADAGGVLLVALLIAAILALRIGEFPDVPSVAGLVAAAIAVPVGLRLVTRPRSMGPKTVLRVVLALAMLSVTLSVLIAFSVVG